jgi:hypothetical protein
MKEEFDLSHYLIRFESLFNVPEIGSAFYKFLKSEFNTENWDFILELEVLQKLCQKKNTKKILLHVNNLKNTFIVEKSPKEIQVGISLKKEILELISQLNKKSWDLKVSPQQLFEPLEKVILMEYKNDSFKRFIRTPDALELIKKHKNNSYVLSPLLSQVYNYKDEDFQNKPLNSKDVEFFQHVLADNANWEIIFSDKKSKLTGYNSHSNYFPSVSFLSPNMINGKAEMFFDYPLQAVALAVYSNFHKKNPFIIGTKVEEYVPEVHSLVEESLQLAFFGEPRVKKGYYSLKYDAEAKSIILLSKPCQISGVPFAETFDIDVIQKKGERKKMKAVQYFAYSSFSMVQVDENRTFVQQLTLADFGGSKKLDIHAVSTKFFQHFQMSTEKMLKSMETDEKISSHKYALNELWEGLPVDPVGKLLMDLNLEATNKSHQEKMEKRLKVFNPSNYVFHFSALKRKEISDKFYEFLKKEHNSDSWDFILDVNKLRLAFEKKNKEKETEILQHVMDTYIQEKSKKDLSLDGDLKQELFSSLKLRIPGYPVFKYFDKIYQKIKLEHQLDSFKRFGKSDDSKDVLAKYQHDVEVMTPIVGLLSNYKDRDFKLKSVSNQDLDFAKTITNQSETWDSLVSNKDMNISYSKVNWFPEVSFIDSIVSFEFIFTFNFPMEQVINGYLTLSKMNKIDPNISKSKLISFNENDDFQSSIIDYEMVWDWSKPLKKKNISCFFVEGMHLTYISKPLVEDVNDKKQYFQYEIINLKSNGISTKFQHIISIHSKESVDWTKFILERGKAFYYPLYESISKSPKTIESCVDYQLKGENNLPKDALAFMLSNISFTNNSFVDTTIDDVGSESSFIDEDDFTDIGDEELDI